MTNLSIKFDSLSDQMSRLLQLFEISAKTFVVKQEELTSSKDDQELVKKLDVLMDQNKTIAKGLTLVEEKIRHRIYGDLPTSSPVNSPQERIQAKPLPRQIPKF
jgi:transcriptional regulator of NAD metabolism